MATNDERDFRALLELWEPDFQRCCDQYQEPRGTINNARNIAKQTITKVMAQSSASHDFMTLTQVIAQLQTCHDSISKLEAQEQACEDSLELRVAELTETLQNRYPLYAKKLLASGLQSRLDSARVAFGPLPEMPRTHEIDDARPDYGANAQGLSDATSHTLERTEEMLDGLPVITPTSPSRSETVAEPGPSRRNGDQVTPAKPSAGCEPSSVRIKGLVGVKRFSPKRFCTDPYLTEDEDADNDVDLVDVIEILGSHSEASVNNIERPDQTRSEVHGDDGVAVTRSPDRRTHLDKSEVEGRDLIFEYHDFGPGFFVLRCDPDTPMPWSKNPMMHSSAINHWNTGKNCGDHDSNREYTRHDIMKEFAFHVEGIDRAFVDESNRRYQEALEATFSLRLDKPRPARGQRRKKRAAAEIDAETVIVRGGGGSSAPGVVDKKGKGPAKKRKSAVAAPSLAANGANSLRDLTPPEGGPQISCSTEDTSLPLPPARLPVSPEFQ